MSIHCSFLIYICINFVSADSTDKFIEELVLKPLYDDQLYAHFQFTTIWDVSSDSDDRKLSNNTVF